MGSFTRPLRHLTSCKRGLEDRRPILCIARSPAAPSVLVVKVTPGDECEVHLPPRYTALLLALVDAWQADEGEVETLRGYRTAAELGGHYAKFSHTGASITEETVRAYVYEIKVRIARKVSSLYPGKRFEIRAFGPLEALRMVGYRIDKCGLEIVQARLRDASDD